MTKKHIITAKTCVLTWVWLMAGFVLTLVLARMRLEKYYTPLALAIAGAQTVGVMAYFMHARASSRLTWLFAIAGIYWLGILFVLGLSDYLSRGWLK